MICPTCHANGVIVGTVGRMPTELPCPECGGSGIVHCCEGERPDQCPEHSRGATPKPSLPAKSRSV